MSDAKHTPGPWIVDGVLVGTPDPTGEKPGVFDSLCGLHSMDFDPSRLGDDEDDEDGYTTGPITAANGKLIAAAPDLLAALQAWQELRDSDGYDGRDAVEWIEKTEAMMRKAIAKATGK